MAKHSQHQQQGNSTGRCRAAGQAVVDLCGVSESGLMFWSRQRFEIGAELQIRVRRDALPKACDAIQGETGEWVTVNGFVVECPAMRKPNGEHGFQVSLMLESALAQVLKARPVKPTSGFPKMRSRFPGLKRAGLN